MTLFDLLFLALAFVSVVTFLGAAAVALGGDRKRAGKILKTWGICFGGYMAVVVVTSTLLPRRVAKLGEPLCSDDWCLTVERMDYHAGRYLAGFLVSSRALRVTQREYGVSVYLVDDEGRRYQALSSASDVPFDVPVGPGEAVEAARAFDVPAGTRPTGLVIHRGSGFPIGWFIIGYETWFRKPTIVRW